MCAGKEKIPTEQTPNTDKQCWCFFVHHFEWIAFSLMFDTLGIRCLDYSGLIWKYFWAWGSLNVCILMVVLFTWCVETIPYVPVPFESVVRMRMAGLRCHSDTLPLLRCCIFGSCIYMTARFLLFVTHSLLFWWWFHGTSCCFRFVVSSFFSFFFSLMYLVSVYSLDFTWSKLLHFDSDDEYVWNASLSIVSFSRDIMQSLLPLLFLLICN